jgi:copper chaperone CopZ
MPDKWGVDMEKTSIYLSGLSCDGCVRTVTRAIMALNGVDSAEVSADYSWAEVFYDPERTNPEEIAKAVEAAGYGAEL